MNSNFSTNPCLSPEIRPKVADMLTTSTAQSGDIKGRALDASSACQRFFGQYRIGVAGQRRVRYPMSRSEETPIRSVFLQVRGPVQFSHSGSIPMRTIEPAFKLQLPPLQ